MSVVLRPDAVSLETLFLPKPPQATFSQPDQEAFQQVLQNPTLTSKLSRVGDDLAVVIDDPTTIDFLWDQINSLMGLSSTSRRFPGPLPIPLRRQHVEKLYNFEDGPYKASYKADGVRYALFFTHMHGQCRAVLLNRALRFEIVSLPIPVTWSQGTLLDGELVRKSCETGLSSYGTRNSCETASGKHAFLFFDVLAKNGIPSHRRANTYDWRLNVLGALVESEWNAALDMANKTTVVPLRDAPLRQAFTLQRKTIVDMADLPKLVNEIMPKLDHGYDGLCFTLNCDGARVGQNPGMFKFKWDHTADMSCLIIPNDPELKTIGIPVMRPTGNWKTQELNTSTVVSLWCATKDGKNLRYVTPTIVTQEFLNKAEVRDVAELHNKVLECCLNVVLNLWEPISVRKDRNSPNSLHTVMSTSEIIAEKLTLQELMP